MKSPLLFSLGFLAPTIFALDHHASTSSQPIFVLKTTHTATSVLGKALGKLGYTHQGNHTSSTVTTSNTFVEVTSDAQLSEIATSHPEAKFIVPRSRRASIIGGDSVPEELGSSWWWGQNSGREASSELLAGEANPWFAQAFLSESEKSADGNNNGILELDVLALEAGTQAENWVRLCDFLGMGYSVVERLGLWHFPQ